MLSIRALFVLAVVLGGCTRFGFSPGGREEVTQLHGEGGALDRGGSEYRVDLDARRADAELPPDDAALFPGEPAQDSGVQPFDLDARRADAELPPDDAALFPGEPAQDSGVPDQAPADVIQADEGLPLPDACCADDECCADCVPLPRYTSCKTAQNYPGECDGSGACYECIPESSECGPSGVTPCCDQMSCELSGGFEICVRP